MMRNKYFTFNLKIFILLSALLIFQSPAKAGVTFSSIQCEYLGLDWKEAYNEILGLKIDIIRLGAYWNRIEREEGSYDFSELDWQIKEAKKRGIPVILTVGMKAPRWPEFFIPGWVLSKMHSPFGADITDNEFLRKKTLAFIEAILRRYQNEPIISAWQAENEPLNRAGKKDWRIGKIFLKEEIALIKRLDRLNRPVIVNVATYPNKFLRSLSRLAYSRDPISEAIEAADIVGINVYPVIGHMIRNLRVCFWSSEPERNKYFTSILNSAAKKNKQIWATELQAEPWEPGTLVHIASTAATTCWPESIGANYRELASLGIDKVLLWGAEYWYFRKIKHNDSKWWDAVKGLSF